MSEVKLHSASEDSSKFMESPFHKVHWVKCPKCGKEFWFALYEDRPTEYVEEIRSDFQEYLYQNPCSEHP
jgi:phage terminase large subunit GpA-like protein